ncbi:MAG: sigma-54-dependent Fis family transcriptional regulator [Planctomycetes bacterium]|nr:sigma-54-dependent Fis family transcriptional regulator [Planctomycetota bacterium]
MKTASILLLDDDPAVARDFRETLLQRGFRVLLASDPGAAKRMLESETLDVAIADARAFGWSEDEVIEFVKRSVPTPRAILTTAFGSIRDAVEAMRRGAFDYVQKPFVEEQLLLSVEKALEQSALEQRCHDLESQLDLRLSFSNLIGRDQKMRRLFQMVETIADTRATVLITGESGTGKTMLARAIHHHSARRGAPFVEVNSGALPETLLESELFGHVKGAFTGAVKDKPGKFEMADGGTIFLDEIATAPPALQVKLLRVVQDRIFERVGDTETRQVDVRMILATNRDLGEEVRAGRFREDLFYRIHVVNLELPPLRDRLGDIPALAESFLERYAQENQRQIQGFSREAMDRLVNHRWPGNVRELENVVERAVVLCRRRTIGLDELPESLLGVDIHSIVHEPDDDRPILPLKRALEEPERRIIERALRVNDGNRQKTAEMLAVNRTTLFNKMRKYDLLGKR